MLYKVVKITNPKNVLVQLPCAIVNNWGLLEGDGIEVHVPEDGKAVVLKPKKMRDRGGINTDSKEVVI